MSSIQNLDLHQLRTMWSHLDKHIFRHLEAHQIIGKSFVYLHFAIKELQL